MPLNQSIVLQNMEMRLGFQFNDLEISADDMIRNIQINTLPTFSKYFPNVVRIRINDEDRVENYDNVYYINIPTDVININRVVGLDLLNGTSQLDGNALFATPRAGYGITLGNPIDNQIMNNLVSMQINPTVFRFIRPNMIEIVPSYNSISDYVVEINSVHENNFGSIPMNLRDDFLDLAYSDTCRALYPLRTRYQNLQTSFGSIELNADMLNEGMQMRNELIEKWKPSLIRNSTRRKVFFG